jgi:hypothetical protein
MCGVDDAGEDQIVSISTYIVCVCGEQCGDVVVDDEDDNKSAVRSTKCTENLLSCVFPTVISSPQVLHFPDAIMHPCRCFSLWG